MSARRVRLRHKSREAGNFAAFKRRDDSRLYWNSAHNRVIAWFVTQVVPAVCGKTIFTVNIGESTGEGVESDREHCSVFQQTARAA